MHASHLKCTLWVQANKVGGIGTLYTASYYNNQPYVNPALQDTWVPINTQSQAFCVGATLTSIGEAFQWGGDNECVGGCHIFYLSCCDPVLCQRVAARRRRQGTVPSCLEAWYLCQCMAPTLATGTDVWPWHSPSADRQAGGAVCAPRLALCCVLLDLYCISARMPAALLRQTWSPRMR